MSAQTIRVLAVVDDPDELRRLEQLLVHSPGHRIELLHAGELAAAFDRLVHPAAQDRPDAVLLDLSLPDSQGWEALGMLTARAPGVPVVLLCEAGAEPNIEEAVRRGAQDAVSKGDLTGPALVHALAFAIERKRAEEAEKARGPVEARDALGGDQLRALLDHMPDYIYFKDAESRFIRVNEAFVHLVGRTSMDEVVGKTDFDIFEGEFAEQTFADEQRIVRTGEPVIGQVQRYARPDGTVVHLRATKVPARDPDGSINMIVGITTDVTSLVQAEEAVRESEERYRTLFDGVADAIVIHDLDGRYLEVNKAACERLGYSREELLRMSQMDVTTAEHAHLVRERLELIRRRGSMVFESSHANRDGKTIPVELNARLMQYKGRPAALAVARDITDRKQAEEQLRQAEAKYRNLVEQVPALVYISPPDNVQTGAYVSPQLEALLGFTPEEWLANPGSWARQLHPEDREGVLASFAERQDRLEFVPLEYRMLTRSGETKWLRDEAVVVRDAAGNPESVQGIVFDVTDRKRADEALAHERRLLRTLVDSLPDHIYVKDNDGRMVLVNEAQARSFGLASPEAAIGRTDFDLGPADVAAQIRRNDETVMESGQALAVEEPSLTAAGEIMTTWSIKVPLRDALGGVIGLVGMSRDVTERNQMASQREAALEELAHERRLLRTLIDAVPDLIFVKDRDSRILLNNVAYARVLGCDDQAQTLGHTDADFLPPEQARRYHEDDGQVIETGQPIRKEEFVIGADGSRQWVLVIKVPLRNAQEEIIGLVGVGRDISDLKRAEEELRRLNRALRMLSECSQAVVRANEEATILRDICGYVVDIGGYPAAWIDYFDADGTQMARRVAEAGPAVAYLDDLEFEWDVDETEPGPAGPAVRTGRVRVSQEPSSDPKSAGWHGLAGGVAGGSAVALPLIVDGLTLGVIHILASGPGAFSAEEVKLLRELAADTSYAIDALRIRAERERANSELRKSEERYRLLFNATPVGIAIADMAGNVVAANRAMEKSTGYGGDEWSAFVSDAAWADPAQAGQLRRSIMEGRRVRDRETRLKRKDGSLWWGLLNVDPFDTDGEQLVLVTVRDITGLKTSESERERMQGQLLQAQKMDAIGTLAGGVAHDFNNLLTAILGYGDLAKAALPPGSAAAADLEQIRLAGERAASLTRQLLAFSRKQAMAFKPVDVNREIDGLLGMLRRLIGEDIAVDTDLAPDLRLVMADRGQFAQVVMNLAVNAHDAMPEGGRVIIRTENVEFAENQLAGRSADARPGRFVRVSLTDTGIGIPPETLARVFEPFYTTKAPGKGTGLGLSVAYGIVRQHEGWIDVGSATGQGSTFEIFLPVVSELTSETPRPGDREAGPLGHGERILVVEDQDEVRQFAVRVLMMSGYEVVAAADAKTALNLFERENGRFDLVFSDVVLPDFDGIRLVDELRERRPDCRVLLASGYADDKSRWPLIQAKGLAFIQKPYTLDDLLHGIRMQIDPAG